MTQPVVLSTLRKSIAVLILRIAALQLLALLVYIVIRLSKLLFFRELFAGDDYHDLNFWLGIMVLILVVIVQAVFLITIVLQWYYEVYEIRKDLVVHSRGVLKRKEDIYSLKTVEAGSVSQSLPGKLLNYGTVKIYSPVLKREYSLVDISNPQQTRDTIISLLGTKTGQLQKIIPKEMQT